MGLPYEFSIRDAQLFGLRRSDEPEVIYIVIEHIGNGYDKSMPYLRYF